MKILIIDPADFLGGAELFSVDIMEALSDVVEFTVFTTGKCEEYLKILPKNVERIKRDIPRLRPFRPVRFLKTILFFRKYLKENPRDIVHSNSVRAGIIAAFLRKPWTHCTHDFTFPKCLAFLLKRAKVVFACSEAVKKDLIQKGVPKEKITVMYNGVNVEHFHNIPKKLWDPKKPVVAIIGRIDTWKGQDIFLQAAKILKNDFPLMEFRIYGKSSKHDPKTQEYEKKLRRYVQEHDLKNVSFCGQQPIAEILPQVDIVVHTSTAPEPFGRVILEALAATKPIIASNWGGGKEILMGEVLQKLLIIPKNPQILAEKLQWLIENDPFRKEYEKAAQKRAKDFEMKKIANRILVYWRETCS